MGDPPCHFCGGPVEAGPYAAEVRVQVEYQDGTGWFRTDYAHQPCAERDRATREATGE